MADPANANKFWNRMAVGYAAHAISDQASYARKLAETQACFTPDMQVLEIGCGTGSTAIAHAPHVAHIRATDFSPDMLEIAREKAATAGIENIDFEVAAIETLEAPDSAYDVVLGLSILHLLRDRPAALSTIHRVLKPGGRFISSTMCLRDSFLRFALPALLAGRAIGRLPYVSLVRETDLLAEIRAAGFEIETNWRPGKSKATFVIARRA